MNLKELREKIDSIDNSILELLARRFDLCKDVAECKKNNNLNVRDIDRESEIIKDKSKKFSELGHDEDVFVKRLFSLILDKSRQKIRIHNQKEIEFKSISIIGGRGKMGSLFADEFKKKGHAVLVSDEDKTNTVELAQKGDLVIVTVPMRKTEEVLKEVIPHLREDALLTDFTSVKEKPMGIMKDTRSSYVGGHPLFGPVESLENKNFVLCPGKGNYGWYKEILQSLGLNVTVIQAKEHDENMAVIQCLTHFSNLSFLNLLKKLNFKEGLSTPIYELRMEAIKRMLSLDASMFTEIQFGNNLSKEIADKYLQSVAELRQIINSGNKEKFESLFNEAKNEDCNSRTQI